MLHANHEAHKLMENTGIEWRPVNYEGLREQYLISVDRRIYSINRHGVLKTRRFKKCPSEYIEMSSGSKRRLYQIDELMLRTYPELYVDDHDDWKTIEIDGEKTQYEVSNAGKVRRINNHHAIKATPNSEGYMLIRIRHKGRTLTAFLHRLVAAAFIPNPYGYEIVNHIDENRQNDSVENLEWCDKSYNYKYSYNRKGR